MKTINPNFPEELKSAIMAGDIKKAVILAGDFFKYHSCERVCKHAQIKAALNQKRFEDFYKAEIKKDWDERDKYVYSLRKTIKEPHLLGNAIFEYDEILRKRYSVYSKEKKAWEKALSLKTFVRDYRHWWKF